MRLNYGAAVFAWAVAVFDGVSGWASGTWWMYLLSAAMVGLGVFNWRLARKARLRRIREENIAAFERELGWDRDR